MGCGIIRDKELKSWDLISTPLSNQFLYLRNDTPEAAEINKLIKRSALILYQIEKVRKVVIDALDDLILATGAFIFSTPTIVNCLHCILYLIAVELQGDLTRLSKHYTDEPPFLIISTDFLSQKAIDLYQMIQKYIINLIYLKTTINQLENDVPELLYLSNEVTCEEFKFEISQNNQLIANALKMLPMLKTINLSYIQSYQKECYYIDTMKEVYEKRSQLFCREVKDTNTSDMGEMMFLYKPASLKHPHVLPSIKMESSVKAARRKLKKVISDKKDFIQRNVKTIEA